MFADFLPEILPDVGSVLDWRAGGRRLKPRLKALRAAKSACADWDWAVRCGDVLPEMLPEFLPECLPLV